MLDDQNRFFIINNRVIDLTILENEILKILIAKKNKVINIEQFPCKNARMAIWRLNHKLFPDCKIIEKYKNWYFLEV